VDEVLREERCHALTFPTIGQPLENEADTWTLDREINGLADKIGAVILIQSNVIHIFKLKLPFL
jgi:hypothetical protein